MTWTRAVSSRWITSPKDASPARRSPRPGRSCPSTSEAARPMSTITQRTFCLAAWRAAENAIAPAPSPPSAPAKSARRTDVLAMISARPAVPDLSGSGGGAVGRLAGGVRGRGGGRRRRRACCGGAERALRRRTLRRAASGRACWWRAESEQAGSQRAGSQRNASRRVRHASEAPPVRPRRAVLPAPGRAVPRQAPCRRRQPTPRPAPEARPAMADSWPARS